MLTNKKSEAGIAIIVIVIILALFFGWIITLSQRECRNNRDCGSDSYCGSDFSCHQFPAAEKSVAQYTLLMPSIIIGIAIIIAAIIFRWNNLRTKSQQIKPSAENKNLGTKEPVEVNDISQPYYQNDTGVQTP